MTPEHNSKQKWFDDKIIVILLCIFFFPLGLYALWKNTKIEYGWKVGITLLFAIAILINIFKNPNESFSNEESTISTLDTISDKKEKKTNEEQLNEQLKRELSSLNKSKSFETNTYRDNIENIQMEVVLFATWANIINEGLNSKNEKNRELALELKSKVSIVQVKEFPKMRKAYGELTATKLWESNIYVTTQGAKNNIINFTGALFANNKNIADTERTLEEILTQFRFKEVRYRWYKGDNEFTYYKLETPQDSDIIEIKE